MSPVHFRQLPSLPTPFLAQSSASKLARRAVSTTMCWRSRQVRCGLQQQQHSTTVTTWMSTFTVFCNQTLHNVQSECTKQQLLFTVNSTITKTVKRLRDVIHTYLTWSTKAHIPAASGALAEVPVCDSVQPLRKSVVTFTIHPQQTKTDQ